MVFKVFFTYINAEDDCLYDGTVKFDPYINFVPNVNELKNEKSDVHKRLRIHIESFFECTLLGPLVVTDVKPL